MKNILKWMCFAYFAAIRGGEVMVVLYVSMIMRGTQKFSNVPAVLKDDVRKILVDEGLERLTQE